MVVQSLSCSFSGWSSASGGCPPGSPHRRRLGLVVSSTLAPFSRAGSVCPDRSLLPLLLEDDSSDEDLRRVGALDGGRIQIPRPHLLVIGRLLRRFSLLLQVHDRR